MQRRLVAVSPTLLIRLLVWAISLAYKPFTRHCRAPASSHNALATWAVGTQSLIQRYQAAA